MFQALQKNRKTVLTRTLSLLLAIMLVLPLTFAQAIPAFADDPPPTLYLTGYRLWDANWDYVQNKEITGTLDPTVMVDPNVSPFNGYGNFVWYASLTFNKPVVITSPEDVLAQLNLNSVLSSTNKITTVYLDPQDPCTIIIRAQDKPTTASAQAFSRTTISPKATDRYVEAISALGAPNEYAYMTFNIDSISSTGIKFEKVAETIGTDDVPASVTYKLSSISLIRCANQMKFMVNGTQVGANFAAHSHSPWLIGPADVVTTITGTSNQTTFGTLGYTLTAGTTAGGEPTFTITAKVAAAGETLGWELDQYPTSSINDRRIEVVDALKTYFTAEDDVKEAARALLRQQTVTKAEIDATIAALVASSAKPSTLIRFGGANRYETATLSSQNLFSGTANTVIVARADMFPDAMAAASLAGVTNAPILLVPSADTVNAYPANPLYAATVAELNRLQPDRIYILGSEAAISKLSEDALKALPFHPSQVIRLGGLTRFETARAIVDEAITLGLNTTELYLAKHSDFPDALTASAFAAGQKVPILFTGAAPETTLNSTVVSYINAHPELSTVYILGGAAAISNEAEGQLSGMGLTVVRLGGADRNDTAKTMITAFIDHYQITPRLFGIANNGSPNASQFPDALVGGAAVGIRGGVLLPTSRDSLSSAADDILVMYAPYHPAVEVFGSSAAVNTPAETRIRQIVGL